MEVSHIFLIDNAGCGKSYLVKVIYQALTKSLFYGNVSVDKTQVLFIALTGASAVNIDKNTIHTTLNIPVG